jgi:hypothetical protein
MASLVCLYPVICDAPGGVAWGLTIWRRHKRGPWEYQIEPGSEDDHRVWVARYDNPVPREIDNPPTVVETLGGSKVRAWLPVAAMSSDDDIDDEQRAVKTTAHG